MTLVLCNVAVGRSYIKDDPDSDSVLPPGFDSLYMSPKVKQVLSK